VLHLPTWQLLISHESDALRVKAAQIDAGDVAAVTRLRGKWDADLVHAALQLQKARNKLQPKFPDRWQSLVADPTGAEMATSHRIGMHKARRFALTMPGATIIDLCCGIGGDAMCLRDAGLNVVAVDSDEARAWMASCNARCESRAVDVLGDVPGGPFHLDPARRMTGASGTKRVFDVDLLLPPASVIAEIIRKRCDGAVKLQPGVDAAELAQHGITGEMEVISDEGRLSQAVVWCGALSTGDAIRTATIVHRDGSSVSMTGEASQQLPPVSPMLRFIHEIDPSVERVGLLSTLCERLKAAMPHPALGLLTADEPLHDPFLTPFEVLDAFVWKLPRAKDKLKNLGAGLVEVKTRDKQVDPDAVQRELSRPGAGPTLTLFVLRFDREVRCIVTRRLSQPA
jgi:hypothetical protein